MGSELLVSHRSDRKKFLIRALSWRTLEPFPSTAAMYSVFVLVLGSGGYYNNGEVLKCKVAWEGGGKIIVLCSDASMVVECLTYTI